MEKLYSPSTVKKIIDQYHFKFSKSLGQNFLIDRNIIERIIFGADIQKNDLVIEIGPGIGSLTSAAAEHAKKVIAIEIDKNLIPILKETLKDYQNIEIINQDFLKTDLLQIIKKESEYERIKIIGNLPYYITTPIIMKILEDGIPASSLTVMLQKEVADRIKAVPSTKDYGSLSVAVQFYCTIELIAHVPKEVFIPKPAVDSSVLRLDLRQEKPVFLTDEKTFFNVIKYGFGQRRKTLLNSLTGINGKTKENMLEILKKADIDPQRRAETLSLFEFARLANALSEQNE